MNHVQGPIVGQSGLNFDRICTYDSYYDSYRAESCDKDATILQAFERQMRCQQRGHGHV